MSDYEVAEFAILPSAPEKLPKLAVTHTLISARDVRGLEVNDAMTSAVKRALPWRRNYLVAGACSVGNNGESSPSSAEPRPWSGTDGRQSLSAEGEVSLHRSTADRGSDASFRETYREGCEKVGTGRSLLYAAGSIGFTHRS